MTEILGYGEDSMTLALIQNEEKLRGLLEDQKLIYKGEAIITVWYRPSFGRGEWYGEFDSIIETTKTILLVECKREGSEGCPRNSNFSLRKEQWLRHAIMKYLIENWTRGDSWNKFCLLHSKAFKEFGKELPQDMGSDLAKNLMFFLERNLSRRLEKIEIKNILLFFGQRDKPIDLSLNDSNGVNYLPVFKTIQYIDPALNDSPLYVALKC